MAVDWAFNIACLCDLCLPIRPSNYFISTQAAKIHLLDRGRNRRPCDRAAIGPLEFCRSDRRRADDDFRD